MQDDIHTKHNKRIAKNTLLLYIRMLLVMAINFLITRELIGLLGVVDFGITNVIASIVTMFSFLSNTMAASISRYFNFYIGKNDFSTLKKFFNTSVEIYLLIGLLIFILSETLGVYCFYHKLVIPADRLNAAFIFFQASIFVFLLKVMIIPYYSMIISKEDMGVYATFNILEVSCKLIIVYMLYFCSASFDKLSTYGIALVGLEVVQFLLYSVYSNIKYKECRLFPFFDFKIFKELLSFGGWNLWGALSSLFNDVLINILLNNFFGAVINTARAIALQFSSGVTTFANNFMMASRPQITNYWASGDRDYSIKLAVNSAMFGFFMLLIIVIPIFIDVNFILDLWLNKIPTYTPIFMRLALIKMIIQVTAFPLMALAQSTGKIALYQSVIGGTYWLVFPISWIFLKAGYPPETVMYVAIFIEVLCFVFRILILNRLIGKNLYKDMLSLFFNGLKVLIISTILPLIIYLYFPYGYLRFMLICLSSITISVLAVFYLVFTKDMRTFIFERLKKFAKIG